MTQLLELIDSSVNQNKLKCRHSALGGLDGGGKYYFDPFTFIDWAILKDIPSIPPKVHEWYFKQIKPKPKPPILQPSVVQRKEKPISETEQDKLLKHVAGLALLLSEKSNLYRLGDKPNATQIANSVQSILDALPDVNTLGIGKSSIRDSIHKGLDLLDR